MIEETFIGIVQTGLLAGIFLRLGAHAEMLKQHGMMIRTLWRKVFYDADRNQLRKEIP